MGGAVAHRGMQESGSEHDRTRGDDAPDDDAAERERERQRLVAEVYEAVLRPERYDALMDALSHHLERAGERLATLRDDARVGQDPELEDHFARALALLERMGRDDGDALQSDPRPALVFAADGRVIEANQAARDALGAPDMLADLADRLDADADARLRRVLRDAPRLRPGRLAVVVTLHHADPALRHWAASALAPAAEGEGARVVLRSLAVPWTDAVADTLRAAFDLTDAEVAIARELSAGRTLNEIAEARVRSPHTVKTQLKSVLHKAGVPGQPDLVRLIAVLASMGEADGTDGGGTARTVRIGSRAVELLERGPPDGAPVLFLHGMLDGTMLSHRLDGELAARGLRLVCPVRPGFGASDPLGDPRDALERVADDVAAAMDLCGIDRAPAIGHWSGSLYAIAAQDRHPDRIGGVVCVGGGVPMTSARQIADMAPRQRVVALTARYMPALLPAVLRAGIAQIDRDPAAFMDALYPPGLHDRALLDRLGLGSLVQSGYRFAVRRGYHGFLMDSYHVVRDWSARLERFDAPLLYVHGAHDPVVDAGSVSRASERWPRIHLRVYPDAGQLILQQKPEAVLDPVLAMTRESVPEVEAAVVAAAGRGLPPSRTPKHG